MTRKYTRPKLWIAKTILSATFFVAWTFSATQAATAGTFKSAITSLEKAYSNLKFYSDTTTSVLSVVSESGDIIQNKNVYRFVYHDRKGALIDNYLGQMFMISDWKTVTNWYKAPARYSVIPLDVNADWREQFFPVGGMMDSEHPGIAMLLDRQTGQSAGTFPMLQKISNVTNIKYENNPAVLLEGEFIFSSQGINFEKSDTSIASGKLWIDVSTGLLRKAEYEITELYSNSFGNARKASLTVMHDEVVTVPPGDQVLSDLFTFFPRESDVKRGNLAEMFTAPSKSEDDDGSPNFLLNRPAPLFTAKTIDGESFSLSDYRGKRILLFFWATWCPNSARAVPQIDQLAGLHINDFDVIGVNVDSFVGRQVLQSYYKLRGLSFRSIVDENNAITAQYRGIFIPSAFLIDSYGIVRNIDLGETEDLVVRYTTILEDTP
ncbi:MAG: hypothetical protein DHS20C05_13700 [Hyphococcus sp.]|nr:MAG: hypothetical protein DHS20C05_13700 [Marinicaulis sp.]